LPKNKAKAIEKKEARIVCWEMKDCPAERRDNCPAYPDSGGQCWLVTGTKCGGKEQGTYREKMSNCRKCNVHIAVHKTAGQLQIAN
jgi:hypothetical protein